MVLATAAFCLLIGAANALIHGVDHVVPLPRANYSRLLQEGFSYLTIGGFDEACSQGGQVNPNFVSNYKTAVSAGYQHINTYWGPCVGSNKRCKSYESQLEELTATIDSESVKIGRIWLGIVSNPSCDAWDYGAAGNLAQARRLVAALRISGQSFGIYTSASDWAKIFASQNEVVANDAPLWFVKYDGIESLTLSPPFGGWKNATGKQYSTFAGGSFGLNVFQAY